MTLTLAGKLWVVMKGKAAVWSLKPRPRTGRRQPN
jgi:hypothetical protein